MFGEAEVGVGGGEGDGRALRCCAGKFYEAEIACVEHVEGLQVPSLQGANAAVATIAQC